MKVNEGTFLKKDGSPRFMRFVRFDDLPTEFLDERISGKGTKKVMGDGMELVYDLEATAFRVFNWKTLLGEVDSFEKDEVLA
jgi:hypothetical protein